MKSDHKARGFTMIEVVIVIAVMLIITAGALIQFTPILKNARAETGLQTTLGQMRNARGLAIDQRKKYRLTFTPPRTIQLDLQGVDGSGNIIFTQVSSVDLPLDTQFVAVTGIPTTSSATPDQLPTTGAAIDFSLDFGGGGTTIYFQPDGRALDANNRINNGVVYVARPGDLMSSRAVSLLGTTGRIKGWRLIQQGSNKVWTE